MKSIAGSIRSICSLATDMRARAKNVLRSLRSRITAQDVTDITGHRLAETVARHARERTTIAFHNSPIAIGIARAADGYFIECNDALVRLFGYPREQLVGRTVVEAGIWQSAETRQHWREALRREGELHAYELVLHDAGGAPRNILMSSSLIECVDESCVISFLHDITGQKQAEAELREGHETLLAILETTLDGYWLADGRGNLLDVNSAYCRQSGYTREELLGMHISDLEAMESAAETAKHISHIIETGHDQFESRHRRKDGSIWHVEVSTTYRDAAGGQFFVFLRDISERKQTEADLCLAAASFDSREAIMITDARSVILRVNRAFTEITGYTAEDVAGRTPCLLKSDRHDASFYSEMWETIERTDGWQGEVWDRRKNGEVYPKWLTISAVRDVNGIVTHYVGSHHDITERKQTEDRMQQLAFHDPLTKLPNRRLLGDRLSQAMAASKRSACYGAVMCLDLDNFKPLNDTHGHVLGDCCLIEAADRLRSCVRKMDTVARLGGDEFVVILSDLNADKAESTSQAEIVAEKIRSSLSAPYWLVINRDGKADTALEYQCTASIGVALFINHEASQEDILKWADAAMYQAKAAGRNSIRFHASNN